MMKRFSWIAVAAILTLVVLGVMGCAQPAAADVLSVDDEGTTQVNVAALEASLEAADDTELDEAESAGLLWMREEEKLAHDVYLALYEQWEHQTFKSIAASEQTHADAVLVLLERYGLEDPSAGKAAGQFSDPALQALYDQLVAQGSASLEAALRVGAAVEEIDILDLEEHLAQTERADIERVYENLLKGSRNHLRAFVRVLERQGVEYTPQHLSQEAYAEIVGVAMEQGGVGASRGNSRGRRGGQGGGGRR